MPKRTQSEIQAEIENLEDLRPRFPKLQEEIGAMIDALNGNIDPTADEFNDLPERDRSSATDALNWRDGMAKTPPSATL